MGNEGGLLQRLWYIGMRGDMGCVCVSEKGRKGGKRDKRRGREEVEGKLGEESGKHEEIVLKQLRKFRIILNILE